MKKAYIAILVLVIFSGFTTLAQHTLVTEVAGIKALQGDLYFSIYDNDTSWLSTEEAYKKVKVPVTKDEETIIIKDLPAGYFAIAVYQDLNSNLVMDETEMKIPREPFGFSNNPKGLRGPASFSQAVFSLHGNDTLRIELVNNLFTPNKEKNEKKQ